MKIILKNIVFFLVMFGVAMGFGCSKSAPECSNQQTIEMVKKITRDELVRSGFPRESLDELTINLNAIRTRSKDDKTGKQECACDLVITSQEGDFLGPITYTSELTDKKGEFYVTVYGITEENLRFLPNKVVQSNSLAKKDLELVRICMEAYFVDNNTFKGASSKEILDKYGLKLSTGVTFNVLKAGDNKYVVETFHLEGDKKYVLKGPGGQIEETSITAVADISAFDATEEGSQAQGSTATQQSKGSSIEESGICEGLDLAITGDLIECLDRKYAIADKKLNDVYKDLMSRLEKSRKSALINEQRAWIKEKELKCTEAGKEMEGGTFEIVMIKDCLVQMTEERIEYLKNFK
ncbi:MAG: DUF1311 domain-containing protein [Tissierellales bacterium]|nr:DUF1311 domain-containing protein [Tissierellales bacterium]